MRKNGSRQISIKQYRLTDLFIFAVILVIYDLLAHYVPQLFSGAALFSFCITVAMTLTVMMRWGWYSVFFAVGDGLLLSLINAPSMWQGYLCYGVGNAFMMLLLIPLKFIGKEKIAAHWYTSALFVVVGWVLSNIGITVMHTICGSSFVSVLSANFGFSITGLLALAMSLVIVLILRRLNGMWEDQIAYLKRIHGEIEKQKKIDDYGEEPIDIDEESLAILRKHDDELY